MLGRFGRYDRSGARMTALIFEQVVPVKEVSVMKLRIILVSSCVGALACPSFGQSLRPFKDMVFGQVAAGGGYESWITVSNRGVESYSGSMGFYRAKAQPWNPVVDGRPVANGRVALSIPAGATRTFKVTGDSEVQSGFAAVVANSASLTSLLEGNLTYFVKSGSAVTDSVGVPPSSEFYLATIPFEDFLTIGLALVCRVPGATVRLSVFSQSNEAVGTRTLTVGQNEQWVRFLWEEFGRLTVGRGRLEIQSDVPIAGTALTLVGGQLSSLPLTPTVRTYNMSVEVLGVPCKGQLILWAEGPYFKGVFNVTEIPGLTAPSFQMPVSGQLHQSMLKLVFYAPPTAYGSPEAVGFTSTSTAFSFDLNNIDSSFIVGSLRKGKGNFGLGNFSLSRIH
jgi:hypothetical protein